MIQAKPGDLESKAAELYGAGDTDSLFNGAIETTVPFRAASRRKDEDLFDRGVVVDALSGRTRLREIDPRVLHATQRGVTRQGVDYYMGDEYNLTGQTYADPDDIGNANPIVYRNPKTDQWMILSGHHRAAAALLKGEPLEAIVIPNRTIVPQRPDIIPEPFDRGSLEDVPGFDVPDIDDFAVASDDTVDFVSRDVTPRLMVDERIDAPMTIDAAVETIRGGQRAVVGSDTDAADVLAKLGAPSDHIDRVIRWAHGDFSKVESERSDLGSPRP
jgi:hypothetical protein